VQESRQTFKTSPWGREFIVQINALRRIALEPDWRLRANERGPRWFNSLQNVYFKVH